jgi:phenylalanyl-tRNA synthetase beta chain
MRASVRWLRELCPELPDDAERLAARFTSAGLEVEASEIFGEASKDCVVAALVSVRPHPTRTGLQVVTVEAGRGPQEVVCGAPNVPQPGALVVLAPPGAHLPAKGLAVERRSFGEVVSEGMLCSEAELGLSDDATALLLPRPGTARPGAGLACAMPAARDTIFEIAVTPNRPDALGHIGLAREAAALFGVPFSIAARPEAAPAAAPLEGAVRIAIEDPERCPHYGACVMVDVEVATSSVETRWRLQSLGVRAISNVVDVTNLVMLETGHPMHAFDLDKVRRQAIVVRRAKPSEQLRTLDGVNRSLSEDDLVICDGEGPVALAGVMGGGESEISAHTKRVLFECAYFDPRGIRRAARRHGIHTESSHRFERGVDWGDTSYALARAAELVSAAARGREFAPARIVVAKVLEVPKVPLRLERASALLGTLISRTEASETLGRLGFKRCATESTGDTWQVPTFRPDVAREVDLIEEIGRCRGYDAVPTCLPAIRASRDAAPLQAFARSAREAGAAMGLSEAVTYAFLSPRDLAAVAAPPSHVRLTDPLSEEHSVMRTSLLPGLLRALARARRHGEPNVALFAVGPVFLRPDFGAADMAPLPRESLLPDERFAFAAVASGERPGWLRNPPRHADVWDAKGIAEGLVWRMVRRSVSVVAMSSADRPPHLHPRGAGWIEVDGMRAGSLGVLHPDVAEVFEVADSLVSVQIDLHALKALGPRPIHFSPLPRFPASTRDLAIVVESEVLAGDVERLAREVAADMAERVVLFDRFVGGSVPQGRASLAFHVVYRAPDRTLTDSEVDACHARVVQAMQARFGATLRS